MVQREEKSTEVAVEGGVLISKEDGRKAVVKLNFRFGKEDERIFLLLKTITVFEVVSDGKTTVIEEKVQKNVYQLLWHS